MIRALLITLVLAAAAVATVVATRPDDDDKTARYTVEFDNAFGLVQGGDVKVAGVRAGKIAGLRLDRRTKRALIDIEITKTGFGDLRADVFCEVRPQSLIGEYFVDCLPGKAAKRFPRKGTIPVEQTGSTVPGDLVNNILRRPQRERLGIILSELGAGVAGRGEGLNEAIRRAVPAIRETDRVLAKLADQNKTLTQLTEDADTVLAELADKRTEVTRWVREAKETAAASAERDDEIAEGFRELPPLLEELEPTMVSLGEFADEQIPTLQDLDAASTDLRTFLERLGPFARATRTNVRGLAAAAKANRPDIKPLRKTAAQLRKAGVKLPELAGNLAIILEYLDDRDNAAEKDPRSPGGQGYTGLESILQYVYDQVMSLNVYDRNGYILKVNAFIDKCAAYQNAESVKVALEDDPDFLNDCLAGLGPNQPGVTSPDPTSAGPVSLRDAERASKGQGKRGTRRGKRSRPAATATPEPERPAAGAQGDPTATPTALPELDELVDNVTGTVDDLLDQIPGAGKAPRIDPEDAGEILDFLLAP